MSCKLSDKGLVLLTLYKYGRIYGKTRFQKTIYLLREEYGIDNSFDFIPYYYGPYSHRLQADINTLISLGLVKERKTEFSTYTYEVTKRGKSLIRQLEKKCDKVFLERLENSLNRIRKMKTDYLIGKAKKLMNNSTP